MLVKYAQVEESKHHSWVSCNSGDSKSHEINHHNNTCNGFRKHGTPNTTSGFLTPQDKFHDLYKPYRTITTPPGSMDNTVGPLPTYHVDGTTENASHAMF